MDPKIVKKNIQASSKALEGIEHFLGKHLYESINGDLVVGHIAL